jgi:hypothetical protein
MGKYGESPPVDGLLEKAELARGSSEWRLPRGLF